MTTKPKQVRPGAQVEKFRDLECGEDEEAFRAKFRKVATAAKMAPSKTGR